jgi:hypothetical protein
MMWPLYVSYFLEKFMRYQHNLHQLIAASVVALATILFLAGEVVLAADPTVTIVAPSHNIGDLGAALGNTWTMDSTADVVWKQPDASGRTVNYTVRSGVAGAYGTVLRGETPKGSDLVSAFYTHASVDIPEETYRYLIYRSYIAPHQPGEAGQQSTNGRILYTSSWGPNWLYQAFPTRRYSNPYIPCGYGQWCLHFFDLSQNINGVGSPNPWDWGKPGSVVKAFGLWPHENWGRADHSPSGDSPDYFYLDFLYLTGPIVTSPPPNSRYLVRWNVNDTDGGQVSSKLYYQEKDELLPPSQSPTCDGSLQGWQQFGTTGSISVPALPHQVFLPLIIKGGGGSGFGSGVVGPSNQSFDWNLSAGSYQVGKVYYVCIVVEDEQGQKGYGVSSAPVIKGPGLTPFTQG